MKILCKLINEYNFKLNSYFFNISTSEYFNYHITFNIYISKSGTYLLIYYLANTNAFLTMSRRMASASSSRGKVSPKFANSPYLNSVQPRQSVSSSAQKEKKDKHHAAAKPQEVERQERDHSSNSVVTEEQKQPKQSHRRGERRSRSISTRVPKGSSSVCSYQSIRSSKSRKSSITRIDILLPSEVEKMLVAFSSKYKNNSPHPLLVGKSYSAKQQHIHDDDSSIASASSYTDSFIYRQCGNEVFSSDLFANLLLARDSDQEGPTLTLESAAVDGNVSDLEE